MFMNNIFDILKGSKKKRAVLSDSESDGDGDKATKRKKDTAGSGSDTSDKPKKKSRKVVDDDDENKEKTDTGNFYFIFCIFFLKSVFFFVTLFTSFPFYILYDQFESSWSLLPKDDDVLCEVESR